MEATSNEAIFQCEIWLVWRLSYFQKWGKDGSWDKVWCMLLEKYKHLLDRSSVQLDGIHLPTKGGGKAVGYQVRKKGKTSNMLILTDSRGIPIAYSEPMPGKYNDAFESQKNECKMLNKIRSSNISADGLFFNADAGFDTKVKI